MQQLFPFDRANPLEVPRAAELQRDMPVSRVRLWNDQAAWLVTRYADVRAAFSDRRLSSDSTLPGYPAATPAAVVAREMLPNFLLMDDPDHARIRAAAYRSFTPRAVASLGPLIADVVDRRIDHVLSMPRPVDLSSAFCQPVPAQVIGGMLGLDSDHNDALLRHVMVILRRSSTREEAIAANETLIAHLGECLDRKRREPADDAISRMAVQVEDGVVSRAEILGALRQIVAAGQDSTASTMAMGILLLLQHREQLDTLLETDDPQAWLRAADEIVRFVSVTHFGRRRVAVAELEIAGQLIRAGEGVILAENYANRDAAVFDRPDSFDVMRRNSGAHLGFGAGIHRCLGVHLARAELSASLSRLFARIPTFRLDGTPADIVFRADMTIYAIERLPVAW